MVFSIKKLSHKVILASLLCILPSLFISFNSAFTTYYSQLESLENETDFLAQQMMKMQSLRVDKAERYLKLLSKAPEIQVGNDLTCQKFLRQQLALNDIFSNIGSPLVTGELTCNATSLTRAINVIDRPYIKKAIEESDFSISHLINDRVSNTLSINLAQPVYDPTSLDMTRLVVGVLPFSWWQTLLESVNHKNLLAFITDKNYSVIASYGELSPKVGEHFMAGNRFFSKDYILVKKEYVRDNANHELTLSFWAALPTAQAYELAKKELIYRFIIIVIGFLVSFIVLILSAKYIFIKPVEKLLNKGKVNKTNVYGSLFKFDNLEDSIKQIENQQEKVKQNLTHTESQLLQAYYKQETILKSVLVGIVEFDQYLKILSFSERCQHFYHVTEKEVDGQVLMALNLITENHQVNDIKCIYDAFQNSNGESFEVTSQSTYTPQDDSVAQVIYYKWNVSKVDFETSLTKWVALVEDVTEQELQHQTLSERASTDWLTKLPNRYSIMKMIDRSINESDQNAFSLVLIDLNGFKLINDSFGHDVGDALIIALANRMQGLLLNDEYIGRLGGDEFLLYLPRRNALKRINFLYECFFEPIPIANRTFNCSASFGVAVYPEHGSDALNLIRCADLAMYESKRNPLSAKVYYDESLEQRGLERYEIESALKHALDHNEFFLCYQAVINPTRNKIMCFEALLRLQSAKVGMISPAAFIPIAEESGYINQIGDWVLTQVLTDIPRIKKVFGEKIKVNINLSPYQLKNTLLINRLTDLAEQDSLKTTLVLEITEGTFVDEEAVECLKRLQEIGYCIALDDFGTGFSSLSHISKMPIQVIKIDQSFISQCGQSHRDLMLLKNIIVMAKDLELKIIAEGVEQVEQAEQLIQFGCYHMQGYLYSKPKTLDELLRDKTAILKADNVLNMV